MRNSGLLGPWEKYRKAGLGLLVAVGLFLFVTILVPLGFVALGVLITASMIWKPIGAIDPLLGTYTPQTKGYRVAAFMMALKSQWRMVLNPVVSLGFGPPAPDQDHNMEPGFGPPARLSAYWALLAAIFLGSIDTLLVGLHRPIWGDVVPPGFVLSLLSIAGWFMTIQVVCAIRRIQGDVDSIVGIEPKPAVMLNRVKVDIPMADLAKRSATYAAIPTVLLLIVWAAVKWSWVITAIAAPSIMLIVGAIAASRIAQAQYIEPWQRRAERRDFWSGAFAFMKNAIPVLSNEVDLPDYEEWKQSLDPDDEDPPDYKPLIKVATFLFPPNIIYPDYLGSVERIRGQLDAQVVAIAPIGIINPETGQEKIGSVGSMGFRVWYMNDDPPHILDKDLNHWVRELLCRSEIVDKLSKIRGIGDCVMIATRMVTRPESKQAIIKVDLTPSSASTSIESFLAAIPELQRVLGVAWVRAGSPSRRQSSNNNVISLYLGDKPVIGDTRFINPQSVERKVIDKMEWSYFFSANGLRSANGVPSLIERVKTTAVVDKLVFRLPDGLRFESVKANMAGLMTTSGYEFMEIQMGDDRDTARMTEAERIRAEASQEAKFTIIAARKDPLKRAFNFGDYQPQIMTGREPGVAKIDWYAGVLSDDSLAIDSFLSGDNPHLLVAGQSGSGKSVVTSSFILQIAYNNAPSEARFWMVEPKTEMQIYRHVDVVERFVDSWSGGGQSFIANAADLVEDAVSEMERRNLAFVSHQKQPKNLHKAREIAVRESEQNGTRLEDHPLYHPYIFLILEECASLFAEAADKEERQEQGRLVTATAEIARKARSAGIFLICATQYPTNASLPSVIRNQMRRIGMRCQNHVASNVVIGESGLEDIRIKGVGKIVHNDSFRNFRGFWVQDGDVDYGEANDILDVIAKLPGKNGATTANPKVAAQRAVIPKPDESIYNLWDKSASAQLLSEAVLVGRATKDRDVPEN